MTGDSRSHAADLDLLVEASLAAGQEALKYFRNDVQVWWKNEGTSPVTAADHAANDILKERLLGARAHYGWLSEESEDDSTRLSRRMVFIVDPIDGTRAFMSGKDTWVVSAAVTDGGIPVAGVLYAPALDELYVATADGRVEKNGEVLRARAVETGAHFRLSAPDEMANRLKGDLGLRVDRIGRIPSLAYRLAMIADGRLDATIVKPHAHDWDLAAADLILRNAGGRLVDSKGDRLVYNLPLPRHGLLVAALPGLEGEILGSFPAGAG